MIIIFDIMNILFVSNAGAISPAWQKLKIEKKQTKSSTKITLFCVYILKELLFIKNDLLFNVFKTHFQNVSFGNKSFSDCMNLIFYCLGQNYRNTTQSSVE